MRPPPGAASSTPRLLARLIRKPRSGPVLNDADPSGAVLLPDSSRPLVLHCENWGSRKPDRLSRQPN